MDATDTLRGGNKFSGHSVLGFEVDGNVHERTRRADARRDEVLRRAGYHLLHLEAELVLRKPEAAVALVRAAVEGLG